jgi:hypothetical protein
MEAWINADNGDILYVHDVSECSNEDRPCTIHRPSLHNLSLVPQLWNEEKRVMERKCIHGDMHIDPDEYRVPSEAVNGCWANCDDCCRTDPDALDPEAR